MFFGQVVSIFKILILKTKNLKLPHTEKKEKEVPKYSFPREGFIINHLFPISVRWSFEANSFESLHYRVKLRWQVLCIILLWPSVLSFFSFLF